MSRRPSPSRGHALRAPQALLARQGRPAAPPPPIAEPASESQAATWMPSGSLPGALGCIQWGGGGRGVSRRPSPSWGRPSSPRAAGPAGQATSKLKVGQQPLRRFKFGKLADSELLRTASASECDVSSLGASAKEVPRCPYQRTQTPLCPSLSLLCLSTATADQAARRPIGPSIYLSLEVLNVYLRIKSTSTIQTDYAL